MINHAFIRYGCRCPGYTPGDLTHHFVGKPVQKNSKPYNLGHFRVLIVDDFSFIADMMAMMLSAMGVGYVKAAYSGEDALKRLESLNAEKNPQNIDVVITDWLMPGMGGHGLLRNIRQHKSEVIRFMPVIICSASASREVVEISRDDGATEVIVKPASAEKIAQRLLYIIDKPRPFLKTGEFFGPDRRRRLILPKGGDRRVMKPDNLKVNHEAAA